MVKFWTKEELNKLIQMKASGKTNKEIAKKLGRSEQSISKKYRETNWSELNDEISQEVESDEVLTDDELFKESFINKSMAKLENDKYKKMMMSDIIADKMVKAVKALPEVKKHKTEKVVGKSKKASSSESEDMGLMLSDLHFGAHFTLEETGGLAEFNMKIAKERMVNLKNSVVKIHELHSHLYDIKTLHVFSLGDIVAGMNTVGSWSPVYINETIYDQMVAGFETISDCLQKWLETFDTIEFYGVSGNHGKVAKIGEQKDYCNWDFICHKFLQARFSNNKRIKFHLNKTWWQMAKVKGHNILMTHGDVVRAAGSHINGLKNWESKMAPLIKTAPAASLMGHFHCSAQMRTNFGKVLCNGSLIGPDVYSLKSLASGGKAQQTLFGIHDKRCITWKYDLDLEIERD